MSKVTNNIVTRGLSGQLGKQLVFRNINGKTIVSRSPVSTKAPNEVQMANRNKFQLATLYAKNAISDAIRKAIYQSKSGDGKSPYNIAVADFFNAPDIQSIDLTNYFGEVGDTILIKVTDDVKVESVQVEIMNADGSLVERGNAVQNSPLDWLYTATVENDNLDGDKIVVKAFDMPNNMTQKDEVIG